MAVLDDGDGLPAGRGVQMMFPDAGRLVTSVTDTVCSWPWQVSAAALVLLAFGASFSGVIAYSTRNEPLRVVSAALSAFCSVASAVVIFCLCLNLTSGLLAWLHGLLSAFGPWLAREGLRP